MLLKLHIHFLMKLAAMRTMKSFGYYWLVDTSFEIIKLLRFMIDATVKYMLEL